MSKVLVVVESPSKAKHLAEMLGDGFVVQASGGHIRDLPVRDGENGYDAETLEPVYEIIPPQPIPGQPGKFFLSAKERVARLKELARDVETVLLATDPDREGEAIAWHVAEVLGIRNRRRVKFHEITDGAVLAAVNNPIALDVNLVRAQEARRVIDRMVGWLVSGPLSRAIGERASAGRVQSPSLGLVVKREREIKAFVRERYFGVVVVFDGGPEWSAEWVVPGGEGARCTVEAEALRVAKVREFVVSEFVERDEFEAPPAPFDTATMQQAASVTLGFDPEKTMLVAQKLFEGIGAGGFITYHRTDELNLSDDAFAMIAVYAGKHGLPAVEGKRTWKKVAGAQEAHEAIRPTDFEADTGGLSADELALYGLIHRRAVASQLADVVHSVRRVRLEGEGAVFSAVGRVLKDEGWRRFGVVAESEDEESAEVNAVPLLAVGDRVIARDGRVVEKLTRSPKRYTKASLIAMLKMLGIGRPSTYDVAVDGLGKKGYVGLEKRFLVPKPVAEKIYDILNGHFRFVDVDFTRWLEEELDGIAAGSRGYADVVRSVFNVLQGELTAMGWSAGAGVAPGIRKVVEGVKCPKCGKGMVLRSGAKGSFYGCTAFPKCRGTAQAA